MTHLTFDNLSWLHLLWTVLAVALVGAYGVWQRRRALRRFASANLLPRLTPGGGWIRPGTRLLLVTAALTLLVAALIGPRWGAATQQTLRRNVDVMVLLDVSRSMLARDIAPNRLERAKLAIREDLLPALGGDRIGLITFAGVPSVACPLTTDYGFFRLALDDVTTRSAPRGGTLIGDAIRKAGGLFEQEIDTHKVIILITDGEDHESFPLEAAANLWEEQKIPIIALALGDNEVGARIPIGQVRGQVQYLEYEGEAVRTKSDFVGLERIAKASPQGVFVGVGTSNFRLDSIYRNVVRALRFEEQAERRAVQQPARAHPFAVAALLLVLFDSLLGEGPRRLAAVVANERSAKEDAA